MSIAEIFGSIGVALLLVAFFMNLFGLMSSDSRAYQASTRSVPEYRATHRT